ncbi:hypothetical protein IAC76_07665 [Spirochaetes bacterium]|uniref:DUF2963 domain-containing protein n=1 Tax=Candidatus Scatousia excrementipullorum TaxID=2840936 RepID=A0A9D9DR36_9BACT|nr:hypothetical protein [Candidatus Scatousia excrementipullorum]
MLDSVKFSQVNFKGSTNLIEQFKEKQNRTEQSGAQNNVTPPQTGAEALSNYNRAAIAQAPASTNNKKKNVEAELLAKFSDLKPAEPIKIDQNFMTNFKGDKVTGSDGIVEYYEEKSGDISKIYFVFDNKVSTAYEVNNKTGNMIREDLFDKDGKPISVIEYNPETGIAKKYTSYDLDNGKLNSVAEYDDKGDCVRSVIYDTKTGNISRIFEHDKGIDGGVDIHYEFENGKLVTKKIESPLDGNTLEATRFVDGKELKTIKTKLYPVINNSDIDFSKINLQPSTPGNVELDVSKVNGEKKFRSNNTLESITVKDGNITRIYNMDATGNKLDNIEEKENDIMKRSIRINKETGKLDSIDEFDAQGHNIKSTYFNKNGKPEGVYETPSGGQDGVMRRVVYYDDGKLRGYDISDGKTFDLKHTFRFDKSGNLIEHMEYNEDGKSKDRYYNEMIDFVENKTEDPKNAESIEWFRKLLANPNCEKTYVPQANIVHVKEKGLIDGMEYDVFSNGTVRAYSNWGNDAIIMNSNEEMIKLFNDCKEEHHDD